MTSRTSHLKTTLTQNLHAARVQSPRKLRPSFHDPPSEQIPQLDCSNLLVHPWADPAGLRFPTSRSFDHADVPGVPSVVQHVATHPPVGALHAQCQSISTSYLLLPESRVWNLNWALISAEEFPEGLIQVPPTRMLLTPRSYPPASSSDYPMTDSSHTSFAIPIHPNQSRSTEHHRRAMSVPHQDAHLELLLLQHLRRVEQVPVEAHSHSVVDGMMKTGGSTKLDENFVKMLAYVRNGQLSQTTLEEL